MEWSTGEVERRGISSLRRERKRDMVRTRENALTLTRLIYWELYILIFIPGTLSLTSFLFSPSSFPHLFLHFFLIFVFPALVLLSSFFFRLSRTFCRSLLSSFFALIYPGGIPRDESCALKVGYNNSLPRELRSQ